MNKIMQVCIYLSIVVMLANWSGEESSIDGRKKHAVNFYGVLTTHNGDVRQVENIAIANLIKQITFYEKPSASAPQESGDSSEENKYALSIDPREGIVTKLDLSQINSISVPHPDIIWSHQKKKGQRKVEYIEVVVTSGDTQKTEHHYLMDLGRKITCDQVNTTAEVTVPFTSLKTLTIEGYKNRDSKSV